MAATIGSARDAAVRRVFGDCVPADAQHALRQLEQSPLKPADPGELQAVRELVLVRAQQEMQALEKSGYVPERLKKATAPAATTPMTLRLQEMTRPLDPVVSVARARELFDALAADSSIPHDFIDEGCHFRAHVEAKQLEDVGVYSEKVFYRPTDGWDLKIHSDKSPLGFTLGIFHMAPCILVKTDAGIERRVLDPSLADEPLTLEQWQAKMEPAAGGSCETFFLPRQAYHLSDRYDPPTSWKQEDLDEALAWNSQYKETWDGMKANGFYDHLVTMAEEQEKAGRERT